jgi:hypothetical protein
VNALAFGRRGTYNPANREKGFAASSLHSGQPLQSRATCQEVGAFQSRIRTHCGPVGMQSEVEEYDPK